MEKMLLMNLHLRHYTLFSVYKSKARVVQSEMGPTTVT